MFCQAQSPTHTQQAITAYLADVPLPAGWTEEAFDIGDNIWPVGRYVEKIEGLPDTERVTVAMSGIYVVTVPAHWPAIPLAVLVRAAVQCHRLREAGQ